MVTRDQKMIALAYHIATWSKDPSTKVGAVIVGQDPRQICFGYNGFPPGIADDHRLHDRPTKYRLIQHAERNALDNASFDLTGATLYVTMLPCCECAKSIVSQRIARVVCPRPDQSPGRDSPHWREESNWSFSILHEAGIVVDHYDADEVEGVPAPRDHPSENCPDGLLPDGPRCPKCGGRRGPSGIDGGTWVHVERLRQL